MIPSTSTAPTVSPAPTVSITVAATAGTSTTRSRVTPTIPCPPRVITTSAGPAASAARAQSIVASSPTAPGWSQCTSSSENFTTSLIAIQRSTAARYAARSPSTLGRTFGS